MQTLSRRSFLSGFCSCCAVLPLTSCIGTGGGAGGTSLSQQDEIRLGTESWQRVYQTSRPANNPQLKAMVSNTTTRIINVAGPDAKGLPWEVELFENNEPNAFALPGGKVGVNTGLFSVAENEHQLATVLGHEIRHVTGHHGAKRYEQAMQTQLGLQVVSIALGASGVQDPKQVMSLLGAGANVGIILPFSRDQESEADLIGLDYMHAAGFDARQSVPFWQRMMQAGAGNTPSFLSSHPAGQERITALQQRIAQLTGNKNA
jgi:predicted Zn-dependent protease